MCGASLIHPIFIITATHCAKKVSQKRGFVTALLGQERRTSLGLSPWAQVRRVVSLRVWREIAVGRLESPLDIGDRVSPLCLPAPGWRQSGSGSCVLTGVTDTRWVGVLEMKLKPSPQCPDSVCTEEPITTSSTASWAGALACPDSNGVYSAVGVYYSHHSNPPTQFVSLLEESNMELVGNMIRAGLSTEPVPGVDTCGDRGGLRCGLGNCVSASQVCDRVWDCQEGEDEASNCDYRNPVRLEPCRQENGTCVCGPMEGMCANHLCLPERYFCNGQDDCGDGSDEKPNCSECAEKLAFFHPSALCDGAADCEDRGDEAASYCAGGEPDSFRCDASSLGKDPVLVPTRAVCDGVADCEHGVDEESMCLGLAPHKTMVPQDKLMVPTSTPAGWLMVSGSFYSFLYLTQPVSLDSSLRLLVPVLHHS